MWAPGGATPSRTLLGVTPSSCVRLGTALYGWKALEEGYDLGSWENPFGENHLRPIWHGPFRESYGRRAT